MTHKNINIQCPACGNIIPEATEALSSQFDPSLTDKYQGDMIREIVCSQCGEKYIIRQGVPFIIHYNIFSSAILRELIQYYDFYNRILFRRIEKDRLNFKKDEISRNLNLYKTAFYEGIKNIDFNKKPILLDIGAGMCETSYILSQKGADVIATELSPLDFFNPRIFSLHDGKCDNFYQTFEGFEKITPDKMNFRRIICSAEYLPFADETFDAIFVRSVLHHALSLPKMIYEIARTLKTGGQLIVISEPSRPIFESEESLLEPILDYQEGIREKHPRFSVYSKNLKKYGFEFPKTQLFGVYYCKLVNRIAQIIGYKLNPFFWNGKTLSMKQHITRLPFLVSAVNMYAKKIKPVKPIPSNRFLKNAKDIFIVEDVERFKKELGNIPFAEYIFSLEKRIEQIRSISRKFIPEKYLISVADFSKKRLPYGFKGFRKPEQIAGRFARFAFRDAACVLKKKSGISKIIIEAYLPPQARAKDVISKIKFYVCGRYADICLKEFSGWGEIVIPIAGENYSEPIELRIEQDELIILEDGREALTAFRKIYLA